MGEKYFNTKITSSVLPIGTFKINPNGYGKAIHLLKKGVKMKEIMNKSFISQRKKIIKWATMNGYDYLSNSSLCKEYRIDGDPICDQIIDIKYRKELVLISSCLYPTRMNINNKKELLNLIIPMNRVKADEEDLMEYLEGEVLG